MMKRLFGCIILGLTCLMSCQNIEKTQTHKATPSENTAQTASPIAIGLNVFDFQKKLAANPSASLIDVRTPQEFATGHLHNATLMNLYDADFKTKINALDKTKPVFVYCAVGGRSANVMEMLKSSGFNAVYHMMGGIVEWSAAGLPTE
ncbi:MAG: rhodanese-like domain-containing protein [Saprospiraceae bacterium]|nr:rhodanese-like domain-containing protein [Saprospiraceae bacterium]